MHIRPIFILALLWSLPFCESDDSQRQKLPDQNSESNVDTLLSLYNKANDIRQQAVTLETKVKDREAAIEKYNEALVIFRQIASKMNQAPDSIKDFTLLGIFKATQNKGNCYYDTGDYEKAYKLQQQCLAFLDSLNQYKQVFNWKLERSITAYHYMGRVQYKRDNLDEAIRNYRTAITLIDQMKDQANWHCRDTYLDYSGLHLDWLEADSTIRYAELAIATGLRDGESYIPFINSGAGYGLKKDFRKALIQYDSVLANNPGEDIAKDHHNRALIYLESGDLSKAMKMVKQAITLNSKHNEASPLTKGKLAGNYSLNGDILREEKNYTDAIREYDRALSIFTNIPVSTLTTERILELEPDAVLGNYRINILEALWGKATTLLRQKNTKLALAWYDAAIHLTNRFRQSMPNQSSKIKLAALTKKIFEGAIKASLALSQKEKAFAYAEQSKAYVLMETILQMKARGQLPDVDQKTQEAWRLGQQQLKFLNNEFEKSGTSEEQIAVQKKITRLQKELDRIDSVFQTNEQYRKLTTINSPDFTSVQKLLYSNQALVEYFIGDQESYVFYLPQQGNLEIFPVGIGREALNRKVDSLVQIGIRLPYTLESEIKDSTLLKLKTSLGFNRIKSFCDSIYAKYAYELYQHLLAPIEASPQAKPTRLVVIPDDVLGYMPFDALLMKQPEKIGAYKSYAYAGMGPKGYQMAYNYSAALLKEMQTHQKGKGANKLLAFCLTKELTFRSQIAALQSLFAAPWALFYQKFKNVDTKAALKKSLSGARFLHFATHGKMDDRNSNNSWLLMNGGTEEIPDSIRYLYLYEIYDLPLNAEMVVTSACETGIGRLYQGEGIISLARGFSAAGASSIVTTLWAVNSDTSGVLLKEFYQQLQNDRPKDEALSKAKYQWIQNQEDDKDAEPFFWAGIVPVGDMAAIHLPEKSQPFVTIAFYSTLVLMLFGTGFFFRRRRRT